MNPEKIEELIERSKQCDTTAFRQLVETYQPLVFRLAFRLLCCEDEAKDIVQETFIRVWFHLHEYKSHFRFSTWIYKIACNLCYDKLRAIKRFGRNENLDISLLARNVSSGENIEQSVINQELKDLISKLMCNLTPKQKLVFMLNDIEELELEEIKKITGMSSGKIKSNLYLARQYIRKRIEVLTI